MRQSSIRQPLRDRFFAKVDVGGLDDCWLWRGSKTSTGYGRIGLGGRELGTAPAHRVSYLLHVGEIPDGMVVMHKCDNPSCVNPNHLEVGTQADNLSDMRAKGRGKGGNGLSGEKHPLSKLTASQVVDIRSKRANGRTIQSLADEYGVVGGTIHFVVSGRTWK